MTLDASWPEGTDAPMMIVGRCRDLFTGESTDPPRVIDYGSIRARVGPDRVIHSIEASTDVPGLTSIVGSRGGGRLRELLRETIGDQRDAGTPVYQLLDDLAGVSLIAGVAFMAWPEQAPSRFPRRGPAAQSVKRRIEDVCIGLRAGARSLAAAGEPRPAVVVDELDVDTERYAWHEFESPTEVSMRRARRIDTWQDGPMVLVDSIFQDSAVLADGRRMAVHEYAVSASADLRTLTLRALDARPHILPFAECSLAPANLEVLTGTPMRELRDTVLAHLKGTAGCTHLNDAVRALADVPVLIGRRPDPAEFASV